MTSSPEATATTATSRRSRLAGILVLLVGWTVALLVVRLGLDWSDAQPYQGAVTEQRYLLIAGITVFIALTATTVAIILWLRARRSSRHRTEASRLP